MISDVDCTMTEFGRNKKPAEFCANLKLIGRLLVLLILSVAPQRVAPWSGVKE
jgi:hypothetical protein